MNKQKCFTKKKILIIANILFFVLLLTLCIISCSTIMLQEPLPDTKLLVSSVSNVIFHSLRVQTLFSLLTIALYQLSLIAEWLAKRKNSSMGE